MAESKKKLTLREKLVELWNGGDESRLDKFISHQTKACNRDIKTLKGNLRAMETAQENALETFEQGMEDLVTRVEDAKLEIIPENLKNNADIEIFAETFWGNLEGVQEVVERKQKIQEEKLEKYAESVEAVQADIKLRKDRLEVLKSLSK